MFPSWRMQLGEARRALRRGQLDRACAIVQQDELKDFRQARELSAELAGRFAERARGRMLQGHSTAGWQDVELAQRIAGTDAPVAQLQREYRDKLVDRTRQYLAESRTAAARQELAKLVCRKLADAEVRNLDELATRISEAEQMLSAGNSAEARQTLDKLAANLSPEHGTMNDSGIAARVEALSRKCNEHASLSGELMEATEQQEWHQVLAKADQLLTVAPRDRVARAARRQAWHAVGLDATKLYRHAGRPVAAAAIRDTSVSNKLSISSPTANDTMPGGEIPNRFMMWVDSVGGFLVCLDDEVVLGQPAPGAAIAIPLCADLSRRHAVIRREGGTYTLDPLGDVTVDGRQLTGPMVLGNHHEIQLGSSVRLQFTKPHALSATARLTPLSGHRTEPRADAVLLMADSCVLGPKNHSHVVCRKWPGDIMLFRQQGRLHSRSTQPMTIDGVTASGATPLESDARIEGEEFALSLEDV